MKNKIIDIITKAIAIISIAFLAWVALSWGEIMINNMSLTPTNSQYNFFVILIETKL